MSDIRKLLMLLSDGEFHSGEALGAALGISRAGAWKRLQGLEALDIPVESVKGLGYRLPGGLSLLREDAISAAMSSDARQKLHAVYVVDEIDSTNRFLLDRPVGRREACLAERQTAGRGRRGRVWFSPYGRNLYLSLSWTFHQGVAAVQGLSLAVGVAVAQGLHSLGLSNLSLKWPNDLLWQDRKLGGVLIELSGDAAGECKVVVGIGLNVSMSELPAEQLRTQIGQPWADLKTAGLVCDRNILSAEILNRLVGLLDGYHERGFDHYRTSWQELNAHSGRTVELLTPATSVSGVMLGVTSEGALLLGTELGVREFTGGEISVRGGNDR